MVTEPQIGDSVAALDTPAMLVDLELMERNIARMMERFQGSAVAVRPHLKTTKCPELAHKLLAAGAQGACVAKVSEAEVMAAGGVEDLLITTEIVGQPKVSRLVELFQQHPSIKIVVDNLLGADEVNRAVCMGGEGRQLQVLIDINVGQNRTGVEPGEPALKLARQIKQLPGLQLIGLQGYEGHLQHVHGDAERAALCHEAMSKLTATAELLRQNGFRIDIVTTGGTGTAAYCAAHKGVTEVQPGSFIFMDTDYRNAIGPVYSNALTIMSTVISRPAPRRAVIDAGMKSLSTDSGDAEPKGYPAMHYRPAGDEHGILEWEDDTIDLEIGAKIEMIPSHIDTTVNLHDYYLAHRDGRVEAIWKVAARGKVQ